MSTDVLDNVESVNVAKFIPEYANEPFHPFFHPYKAEIEAFSRVLIIFTLNTMYKKQRLINLITSRNPSTLRAKSLLSSPLFSNSPRTTSPPDTRIAPQAKTMSDT